MRRVDGYGKLRGCVHRGECRPSAVHGWRRWALVERSMADVIQLKLPTTSRHGDVASLVLGGIGTRLDLSYERTDDVQLAVLSMLEAAAEEEVTIEVTTEDGRLDVTVGPLRESAGSDEAFVRVLRGLSDHSETTVRDGGCWATISLHQPAS
jgi:hypothetical protein